MSSEALLEEFYKLGAAERVKFLVEAWDSLRGDDDFCLTPELREELDRRLADYEADPHAGQSWEQVKAELLRKS